MPATGAERIDGSRLDGLHLQYDGAASTAAPAGMYAGSTQSGVESLSGGKAGPVITRTTDGAGGQALSVRMHDETTRTHVRIGEDGSAVTTIQRPAEGPEATTESHDPDLAHGLAATALHDVALNVSEMHKGN